MTKASLPTSYPPRSKGKLRVMARRLRMGLPLFHPLDAPMPPRFGVLAMRFRNGIDGRGGMVMRAAGGSLVKVEGYRWAPRGLAQFRKR